MRVKVFSMTLFLVVMFTFINICQATEYDHEANVDGIVFAWKVADDNLNVKLSAKTTGWVGIGFNPTNQMQGADYILGYVKKNKVSLRDDYGDSERNHKSDEKLGGTSNVTLVGGEEKGGMTTVEFSIPLNSGDKYDSVIDPTGDTVVLLAYGAGRDSFRSKHKERKTIKVNLSSGKYE